MIEHLYKKQVFFGLFIIGLLTATGFQNLFGMPKNTYKDSFPYITGNTFRNICDHKIDNNTVKFDPASVCPGDTIFVKIDYVEWFLKSVHPKIVGPYILITHNGANGVTEKFMSYLEDENLYAWFGQNSKTFLHPKLFHLPLGLANRHWRHGNVDEVKLIQEQKYARKHLLYMNFMLVTNKKMRSGVYDAFKSAPYCYYQKRKDFKSYLIDTAQSKFVLSPPGRGEDCHRTWEALYMGAIPIVYTSFLDAMFEGLPVIIIEDWSIITKEFLENKYLEIGKEEYNLEKLYAPYWIAQIKDMQNKIRSKD